MKKISEIYQTKILTESYNNSDQFSYEKANDNSRYVFFSLGFIDTLREDYNQYKKLSSDVCYAHRLLNDSSFSKNYSDFIKNNIMKVEVELIKNKKSKKFTDIRLTDYLIDFCNMLYDLNEYNYCLQKYKKIRDEGIKKEFIFEYGEEYKNFAEYINVNLSLKVNNLACKLLKNNPEDKKLHDICKEWLTLLKSHAPIQIWHYEYNITTKEIENFIPFTQEEQKLLNKLYKALNLKYKDVNEVKKEDDKNEKIL